MSNEADTCRKQVVPKLKAAGWDDTQYPPKAQRIAESMGNIQKPLALSER